MTDEEIVKRAKEAEKRTGFGELVHSPISKGVNSAFGIGFIEGMVEYRNFLQEEPVSDDLEEAAKRYATEGDEISGLYIIDEEVEAFKAGANWQKAKDQETIELAEDHAMLAGMEKMKEEMMAKAVDVEVHVDAGGYPYIPQMELYDYDKDVPLAKEGDKYKVVLIKEDGL